jgi:predicted ATPase
MAASKQVKITDPTAYFGFQPGSERKLIRWADLLTYFQDLASSSDRIIYEQLGTVSGDQPFVLLTISTPENLSMLDHYRDIQRRLADPRRLTDDEAGSLIDYLYTRAEGNPFFTLELLRDLEWKGVLKVENRQWHLEPLPEMPVPVVVRQIIESRLRWLDDANFALLDVASIIGQEVPIDLWQDVSGASDDEIINAVEQARDLHIASETTDRHHVRFTHGLIRETFYRSKSAMRRRKQHRKVAEALISRADPAPGLVAHHFTLGDDPRAISWLIQAGEHAARMFATEDAISYFTEALAQASHHQQATPIPALRGRAHGYEVL